MVLSTTPSRPVGISLLNSTKPPAAKNSPTAAIIAQTPAIVASSYGKSPQQQHPTITNITTQIKPAAHATYQPSAIDRMKAITANICAQRISSRP